MQSNFVSRKHKFINEYNEMQKIIEGFLVDINEKDRIIKILIEKKNELIEKRINVINFMNKKYIKIYNIYDKNISDKRSSRDYIRFKYHQDLKEEELWTNVVKRVEEEVIRDADENLEKLAKKSKFIEKLYKLDKDIFEYEDYIDNNQSAIAVLRGKMKEVYKKQRALSSILRTKFGFETDKDDENNTKSI